MSDYLLFPILELVIPFLSQLGIDSFWLCIASYFLPALVLTLPIVGLKLFRGDNLRWYECVAFLIPGFLWGFLIMTSAYQLSLSAMSFYIGLFGWLPFSAQWLAEFIEEESTPLVTGTICACLCLIPVLATAMSGSGELGPPIAIKDYIASPDIIIF